MLPTPCYSLLIRMSKPETRVKLRFHARVSNNVCLVGAPGVGKTAVAEAVAQRIAEGRVPPQLQHCQKVWSLDIGALLRNPQIEKCLHLCTLITLYKNRFWFNLNVQICSIRFLTIYRFERICVDLHRCSLIFMNFNGFPVIFMDVH